MWKVLVFWLATQLMVAPAMAGESVQRVPTVTRLVQMFSVLEQEVATAVARGDQPTLDRLLDRRFEMQVASGTADTVPREPWLRLSKAEAAGQTAQMSNMAVRDLEGVAVVTFDWTVHDDSSSSALGQRLFVTDLWKPKGDGWQLVLRIVGRSQASDERFPGQSARQPVIEKKY